MRIKSIGVIIVLFVGLFFTSGPLAAQSQSDEKNLEHWRLLSPREQQVTALVCLNHSNRQIAARLSISPRTVKTHVRNILHKFGVQSKDQLRSVLDEWEFSAWLDSST